ncbi:MAG: hypothetical protein OXT74_02780 [Candidatus Poribacteria bacterium]|nr:hypothetical protein [Candidatus Poribacteria bacterium]
MTYASNETVSLMCDRAAREPPLWKIATHTKIVKAHNLPILPEEIQTGIQHKITESFDLRKKSRRLLESAKRAVEIAIDEDEQTAIEWLDREAWESRQVLPVKHDG